ncbi:hypothetical protein HEB94_002424 [Actinopolymorpha pittospori]|uniref:Uncharacterized protein n=1 Tax=Actinopolymorpha pittospori TaxID=648752 RepID=A0A927MSL5_9ACTN|nr:hypothetical protein [Actinopolymorpha pittospori]
MGSLSHREHQVRVGFDRGLHGVSMPVRMRAGRATDPTASEDLTPA